MKYGGKRPEPIMVYKGLWVIEIETRKIQCKKIISVVYSITNVVYLYMLCFLTLSIIIDNPHHNKIPYFAFFVCSR